MKCRRLPEVAAARTHTHAELLPVRVMVTYVVLSSVTIPELYYRDRTSDSNSESLPLPAPELPVKVS